MFVLITSLANTTCGEVPDIPNGRVTPPRRQSKDARIKCDDGYYTEVFRLTCHEGEWIPPKTICTRESSSDVIKRAHKKIT